jgi:hypothetical protein
MQMIITGHLRSPPENVISSVEQELKNGPFLSLLDLFVQFQPEVPAHTHYYEMRHQLPSHYSFCVHYIGSL